MSTGPLEEILSKLARGEPYSLPDLAEELGMSQVVVEDMLGLLERNGYIRQVEFECRQECEDCPVEGLCLIHAGRVWAMTEDGKRVARGGTE